MKKIEVELIIDKEILEPKIKIYSNKKSKEIESIIELLNNIDNQDSFFITGLLNGKLECIKEDDIIRIGRKGRQVILETKTNEYYVKKTLLQLEEELNKKKFIRISQSEIINAYKVKKIDISLKGTIEIEFDNGLKSYVSRRNVKIVKQFFENKNRKEG